MTTKRNEVELNETNIQAFAALVNSLGGPEDAENALRNLGVPHKIYSAFYEDFLAKQHAEKYISETYLHHWDDPEP